MESLTRSALYDAAHGNRDGVGEAAGTYYLTLCPVTTPVTVPESKFPSLQRYRFFFSRGQESGRESYWLNFGYFRTAEEAGKWCAVLSRVYPAAVIHGLPQNRPAQPPPESPRVLTDAQVFSLLSRKSGDSAVQPQPRDPRPARRENSLEDTLNELRDSVWQSFDREDTASATGVRRLRREVQTKSRWPVGPPGPRVAKAPKTSRKF